MAQALKIIFSNSQHVSQQQFVTAFIIIKKNNSGSKLVFITAPKFDTHPVKRGPTQKYKFPLTVALSIKFVAQQNR
jgi:hypothetical protein